MRALLSFLAGWRELVGRGEHLPIWSFLKRQGVRCERIGERSLRLAGMRCALCDSRRMCAARRAAGFASPVADCPNATLFSPPAA